MSAKRYDLEQQEQIARMSIGGGKSGNQIAEELGINKNSGYKWINQYKKKTGIPVLSSPKPVVNKEDKLKIRELEKLLRDKEEEIEILKKAVHIFSKIENS